MRSFFTSNSGLFITLLSGVAASALWWDGYFATLNKPWFTLPLWLLAVLWVGLGWSLWQSFESFHDSLLLGNDEGLYRVYTLLWVLYTGGLYAMFWVGVAWLGLTVSALMVAGQTYLIWRSYPRSLRLPKQLRPGVYIGAYFLVITLYIALYNG